MSVKIGTRFSAGIADGIAVWEVTGKAGKGAWHAVAVESPDWKGTKKAFTTGEIEHALNMAAFFKRSEQNHDAFYMSLKPGQVVHYDNGFGEFVRAEADGKGKLIPIALVGNWPMHALPRRRRNGDIEYGYYPNKILNRETFEPNAGCIYENSERLQKQYPNPALLTPIDLTVPEMTPEQAETARWDKLRESVLKLAQETQKPPREVVLEIKALLAEVS